MTDILLQAFQKRNIPDEQAKRYMNSVLGVFVLAILGAMFEKLSPQENEDVQNYVRNNQYAEIVPIIESKFTAEEWKSLLQENFDSIVASYTSEVLES